ncbi:DUF4012 domain-containing protein [Microbacterium aurantiacum]|uniref:DUF4012 domain-containing protein n=1 Tax=Microbacterium aurantiacum TaxID=162393 RepID=UPI003F499346
MTTPTLPRPARTAGRVFVIVLAVLVGLTVLAAAWIGIRGALAYGHLRDAQTAAVAARASLADPATAADAIAEISAETAAANRLTSDPVWRAAEGVAWIGPQLRAVSTVAASLDDVAGSALAPLVDVASSFSVDSLAPVDGRIDLAAFTALEEPAAAGAAGVRDASAALDGLDRPALLAPLRDAVDEVSDLLDEVQVGAGALARATALIPGMLGADGPRNYLILFQNNAEWRSLGGIPGAVALLSTDDGRMSLAAQESSGDFPTYDTSVLPLGPEVQGIYGERPGRWIQNVTQVPDFPLAAQLAQEMWAREHDGQRVDGVIAMDPVALSYLLEATGPVELPTGDVLTSENAVPLLLNEVYLRYENPSDQDDFFALAAASVFDALSAGGFSPADLVSALARAGDERRLLLWSAHEDDQTLLADTTLAGGLPRTDADVARFGVYLNDGTGSKMTYYAGADTTVAWTSCMAGPRGVTGQAELTVTVRNDAPADAATLPGYITGGGSFGITPGVARTVGYLYLPTGFALADATMSDGSGFGGGVHDGRRVLTFSVDLAPGETATATVRVDTAEPSASVLEVVQTPGVTASAVPTAACGSAAP